MENSHADDDLNNQIKATEFSLKVTASRKRTVTYWGNNNQYDKEEICVFSTIEIPVKGVIDGVKKNNYLVDILQNNLKKAIDRQERELPKQKGAR